MKFRKVILVLIFSILLIACSKKPEISLIDYVDFRFEGVDGKGEIKTRINHNALEVDMSNHMTEKQKDKDILEQLFESLVFNDSLVIEAEPNTNLKNGDEIIIKAYKKPTEELDLPMEFKEGTKKVKVEGLKEIEEIDAFEGINVRYEGTSPYLRYDIIKDSSNPLLNSLQYSSDTKYGEAKNNEPLIVKITGGLDKLLNEGYSVKETEKEFIPTGMDEFPDNLSSLNNKAREQLLKEADDNLTSYIANFGQKIAMLPTDQFLYSFKNDYATFDTNLEKVIHKKAKEPSMFGDFNITTFVYSININLDSYDYELGKIEGYNNEVVYYHVDIKNISLNDGDLLDFNVNELIANPLHKTLDEVERELINSYKDKYVIETMNGEEFIK